MVTKEDIKSAVVRAVAKRLSDVVFLTDEKGYDLTNGSDYSLTLSEENGEIVVKDVYPGRIYARIKIEADWNP